MTTIACPGCGTVSELDWVRRHAEEFCRSCDYPLFWARGAAELAGAGSVGGGEGLRRLPGTAGRVTVAHVECWSCAEPNLATALICIRCRVDLSGPPPTVFEPEPLPPPPPPPVVVEEELEEPETYWWILATAVLGLLVLLVVLWLVSA